MAVPGSKKPTPKQSTPQRYEPASATRLWRSRRRIPLGQRWFHA